MTTTNNNNSAAVAVAQDATAAAAVPASTKQGGTPSTTTQLGQHSSAPLFEVNNYPIETSSSASSSAAAGYAAFNDESVFAFDEGATLTSVVDHASSTGNTYRVLNDDFFSSPEFTDPSPALTSSLSFGVDSCNTSPLLTDTNEAPEYAGMPLFGSNSMDELSLFIDAASKQTSNNSNHSAPSPPRRAAQNAFNAGRKTSDEEIPSVATLQLLQALTSTGFSRDFVREATQALNGNTATSTASTVSPLVTAIDPVAVTAASPALFSSPPVRLSSSVSAFSSLPTHTLDARAPSPRTEEQLSTSDVPAPRRSSAGLAPTHRGVKRRLDSTDLLPMDAPIQPRKYRTPSATSRKQSLSRDESEARGSDTPDPVVVDEAASSDPVVAKRLSNTLAARRSRHRKAEELRELHDQISSLSAEVDLWKRRCMEAEQQRDEILSRSL